MKMKNQTYKLTIKPALEPVERHKIEDVLKELGYHVYGGGPRSDLTACDVLFEKMKP